jgi:S-adenosylmethionine hydrolase
VVAADGLGIVAAHELTDGRYRLPEVSRTFHARDVFAPAAAHIAAGVPLEELGPEVDPETLVRIDIPSPEVGRSRISATVVSVDRFGNIATNVGPEQVEALGISTGDRVELRLTFDRYYALVAETFADAPPGELILYEDSYGLITVAISRGNAARLMGVGAGDELRIVVT